MTRIELAISACILLYPLPAVGQTADLVAVTTKPLAQMIELPAELAPYQSVELHAKVRGFVERVLVDRGSAVHRGQLLAELSAPELAAQIAEAESRLHGAESDRVQAEAQLAAAESTATRLKKAAETPGAIAANEVVQAERQVDAARALVQARAEAIRAAAALVKAQKDQQSYLQITAPFDGVVTDRLLHPGALAGPGADPVLLILQQVSRLRLVVPVPEANAGSIARGARVEFRVPSEPGRTYTGTVARVAHAVDPKTRTMAVELDVTNGDGSLSPGMYPSVKWPVRRAKSSLLVPKTAVVTTTERTFVIRAHDGRAEWVNVSKGVADGELVEVRGNLAAGDQVVRRATDEIRDGAALRR